MIMGGSNLLGGLLSKDPEQANPGKAYQTNPYGTIMAQQQLRNTMAGAGDFGFGNIAKQGNATLGQMFAGRGINPNSGVAMGAQGDMLGGAMAQDAAARRNYAMNLMTYSPGTVTADSTAGAGWASQDFGNMGRMQDQAQVGWGSTAANPAAGPGLNQIMRNKLGNIFGRG